MTDRFKTPELRKVYDFYFAAADDLDSVLYTNGVPRKGNSWTNAFWIGAEGHANLVNPKGSTGYAAYRAGQDWAKRSAS